MTEFYLVGAGGHARSLLSTIKSLKLPCKGIFDENFKADETILGVPVLGKLADIKSGQKLVLAMGHPLDRLRLYNDFSNALYTDNILSPTCELGAEVQLGVGNQILSQTLINACAQVGDNNLINSGAILEHECVIGSHNHISVGATLLGRSEIGSGCYIGSGAVVRDGAKVCDGVTVGANSFVNNDIMEPGTYVGNPVRKIT